MGTLMRSGDQLRASAQLVEAPSGTLLTVTHGASIARRSVPAAGRHHATSRRGTLASVDRERSCDAGCSSQRSCLRVVSSRQRAGAHVRRPGARARPLSAVAGSGLKFRPGLGAAGPLPSRDRQVRRPDRPTASRARRRPFNERSSLNPHLSVAHKFYANLEADIGLALRALVRLLNEANRHGNDPELFAGLVHACRYCGLFEESIAAHAEARRLDPNVPTSLEQTLLMAGDVEHMQGVDPSPFIAGADEGIRVIALGLAGRREEALQALVRMRRAHIPAFQSWTEFLMAWLERRTPDMLRRMSTLGRLEDSRRSGSDLPGGPFLLRRWRASQGTRPRCNAPYRGATGCRRRFNKAASSTHCAATPSLKRSSPKPPTDATALQPLSRKRAANACSDDECHPNRAAHTPDHENDGAAGRQGRDRTTPENGATRVHAAMGTDVGAPDGVPPE